jgi:hypothetical protein
MKTTEKPLKHLNRQLVNSAPSDLGSHRTNAPRDPKQFQNAQQNLRAEKRLTQDSLYNLLLKLLKLDSSNDLWFTRISWWLVMTKISWKNLRWWSIGPICHLFILHVLKAWRFLRFVPSFLWKEFEEKPCIPAIYLINDSKIEETHDFFCNTFLNLYQNWTMKKIVSRGGSWGFSNQSNKKNTFLKLICSGVRYTQRTM